MLRAYFICVYWISMFFSSYLVNMSSADCVDIDRLSEQNNLTQDCFNGQCIDGNCKCDQGWTGSLCDECGGRVMLDSDSGHITDGMKDYAKARECSWVIQPQKRNATIRLRLLEFATECGWDYLYVYDGDSASAPLLATFNGLLPQDSEDDPTLERYHPEVVAKSGTVFIHFFSDVEYVMKGFNISYSVDSCEQNCSGHGTCRVSETLAQCSCNAGWNGEACEIELCPNSCSSNSGLGFCDRSTTHNVMGGSCNCSNHYQNADCSSSIPAKQGFWYNVPASEEELNVARSSHSGVVYEDSMWLYGGMQFGEFSEGGFDVYNFSSGTWNSVQAVSPLFPTWRYGHSSVMFNNKIIVFGGREVLSGQTMDEVWEFSISTKSWQLVEYTDDFPATFSNKTVSPLALWGHTGTLVKYSDGRNVMLVMFGFHSQYEYSGFVFEYDLDSIKWSQSITKGAKVEAAFGHSTTWDPINKLCYVHGGIVYLAPRKYGITDSMVSYDPEQMIFKALRPSGIPRYLHSGLLVNGVLLIYGGCTHNDSDKSTGALCFSPSFLGYHLACDTWRTIPSMPSMFDPDRYGHLALKLKGESENSPTMIIHGGYDGRILDNMLFYQTGSCSAFSSNKTACIEMHDALACVWNSTDCVAAQNLASNVQNVSCQRRTSQLGSYCASLKSCSSCNNAMEKCVWCDGKCSTESTCSDDDQRCSEDMYNVYCERFRTCGICQLNEGCHWSENSCKYGASNETAKCGPTCDLQNSCTDCVSRGCMWCSNKKVCISTTSYVVQFPFGECMKWTNQKEQCKATEGCSSHRTCGDCLTDPFCGWCDNGMQTGIGTCQMGSFSSSLISNVSQNAISDARLADYNISTPVCKEERWFFTSCPLCQCNGHSKCVNGTSECISCEDHTVGDQCERCMDGFFGQATNGGTCQPCECLDRADVCDHTSGTCFCNTKGAIGEKCEKCDNSAKYYGDPANNGTCFYRLLINYSFTFTLTQGHDRYITAINFENTPTEHSDADLSFESQVPCDVILAVHSTHRVTVQSMRNSTLSYVEYDEEVEVRRLQGVKKFSHEFSGRTYGLGDPATNATIRIYVRNFTIPTWIQVSLVQRNNYLLMLLLILFSCFLVLLLLTALGWKLKLLYDSCQQRRQREEELEQMAARPFATVYLGLDDLQQKESVVCCEEFDAISEEMYATGQASTISVVLRMPSGREDEKANLESECCALSIGAALVASLKGSTKSEAHVLNVNSLPRSKKLKVIFKRGKELRSSIRASNTAHQSGRECNASRRGQPDNTAGHHHRTESSVSVRSNRQRSKRGHSSFSSLRSRSVSPCSDPEGNSTSVPRRSGDSVLSSNVRQFAPPDSRSEGIAAV